MCVCVCACMFIRIYFQFYFIFFVWSFYLLVHYSRCHRIVCNLIWMRAIVLMLSSRWEWNLNRASCETSRYFFCSFNSSDFNFLFGFRFERHFGQTGGLLVVMNRRVSYHNTARTHHYITHALACMSVAASKDGEPMHQKKRGKKVRETLMLRMAQCNIVIGLDFIKTIQKRVWFFSLLNNKFIGLIVFYGLNLFYERAA